MDHQNGETPEAEGDENGGIDVRELLHASTKAIEAVRRRAAGFFIHDRAEEEGDHLSTAGETDEADRRGRNS